MLIFPLVNVTSRKIIRLIWMHFAAVSPSLKGSLSYWPGPSSGGRGVVSTCNYEARKYGIHSTMSSRKRWTFVPKRFLSLEIMKNTEVGEQFVRFSSAIQMIRL